VGSQRRAIEATDSGIAQEEEVGSQKSEVSRQSAEIERRKSKI
jgi:hypothetical protein